MRLTAPQLAASNAPAASNGLSFVGISFNAGEQVARVVLESGNVALSASTNDGGSNDVVVMDDFIYGEPQPTEYSETPSEGSSFPVTIMIPLKFLEITTTGVPSGFVNATLRCAPHHTYRVF